MRFSRQTQHKNSCAEDAVKIAANMLSGGFSSTQRSGTKKERDDGKSKDAKKGVNWQDNTPG